MEFNHTESDVMEEIKQLQATIPGLCYHGTHQAVSTGSLTPSCEICTRMAYMSFQLGFRCNAKCPFCFLSTYNADAPDEDEKYNRQALLEEFHRRKDELEGIALTGGEPLLYLPELEACVSEMQKAKPGLYFWVYTNGILADDEHLGVLRDLGIKEVRFNLAATNYSEKTLENVERARGMFEQVVVEVPSYPKQKEKLIGCLGELNRIGIDQLNLQELLVTDANVHRLEGEGYQSGLLFLKKFFLYGSRKMTYEVMRYCIDKKYSFTVNDCSAARFGRMP
ncbi:MAG: radical SAM protein [Anaerolineae bacterium]|nr:radical SAM protein [Anaerolineae bacterium]